ncbi:MAG: hypothetical protein D8M59_06235 [Planctomycetes bacterium]|nr:hypothetical protein [Planctomycetota bacterium]NOG55095.1 hypothetical protein [Planctomycetota bacterium]
MTRDEREFEAQLQTLEPAAVPASLKHSVVSAVGHQHTDSRSPVHGIRWRTAAAIACIVGLAGLAAGRWSAGLGDSAPGTLPQDVVTGSPGNTTDGSNDAPRTSNPSYAGRPTHETTQPYSLAVLRMAVAQDDLEAQLFKSAEALGAPHQPGPAPLRTEDVLNMTNDP